VSHLEDLLAAKATADEALAEAEGELLAELVDAKQAAREDPSEDNRARKVAAVEAIQQWRFVVREGREAHAVGGDAFLSPEQNGG
jgi:hypothetical protein